MKEELIKIRNLTSLYSETKKKFEEEKKAFNEAIQDKMVILGTGVKPASYETAIEFYEEYADLKKQADLLKKEHPRYGEKRVRETLVGVVSKTYQDRALYSGQIVDTFLSFENTGFGSVREKDLHAKNIALNLIEEVDTVRTETIDTTAENINKAIEQAKPYAMQFQKQLEVAGEGAKKAINIGAKVLIKILEDVDRKD